MRQAGGGTVGKAASQTGGLTNSRQSLYRPAELEIQTDGSGGAWETSGPHNEESVMDESRSPRRRVKKLRRGATDDHIDCLAYTRAADGRGVLAVPVGSPLELSYP